MADRLSCILIQLSNLAYSLAYGQPASEQPDGVKTVLAETGVIGDTLKSVQIGVDACAFAETGAEAILFFRGTLPPWLIVESNAFFAVVKDWLDDANIALVKGQNLPGARPSGLPERSRRSLALYSGVHGWHGKASLRHRTQQGRRIGLSRLLSAREDRPEARGGSHFRRAARWRRRFCHGLRRRTSRNLSRGIPGRHRAPSPSFSRGLAENPGGPSADPGPLSIAGAAPSNRLGHCKGL